MILIGDCLEVMKTLDANSVDSIVTDPPYGLSFMGKRWDYDVPSVDIWAECLRVLKPGGYLLAFAGTRTQHRMACRIEDGGFEIRDMIAWVYGSGFPKSLDVSKAIDKAAGVEREVIGENPNHRSVSGVGYEGVYQGGNTGGATITAPATDAAKQWAGWGTALKPAMEPITVARKPLVGTVAENVLAHGTGALNIDGCRIGTEGGSTTPSGMDRFNAGNAAKGYRPAGYAQGTPEAPEPAGRWPANLIHDGSEDVLRAFPDAPGQQRDTGPQFERNAQVYGTFAGVSAHAARGDTGSAARFFYCAKATRADRNDGCEGIEERSGGALNMRNDAHAHANGNVPAARSNHHPTVKPTDLMRYLCRLVTPKGGTVLDPFMGSGSTGRGAVLEGFEFIGIEREPEYLLIAEARIAAAVESLSVPASAKGKPKPADEAQIDMFGAAA